MSDSTLSGVAQATLLWRRSLILAALAALVIVIAVVATRLLTRPVEQIREKDLAAPALPIEVSVPMIPFTNVTDQAGIAFHHSSGATGERLLPETMGSGVAWLDFDGDGDQDLALVSSGAWPWSTDAAAQPGGLTLYANDGTGRFEEVPAEAGENHGLYAMGVAVGDADGDGRVDLYVTAVGRNRLLRNLGRTFVDVTDHAGVGGDDDAWSTSAGFFDADGDGDLDLFVCHYVQWSRGIDHSIGFTLNGVDRAYGPPTTFRGTFPTLYQNQGDGTFVDISAAAGIQVTNPATGDPMAKALGLAFADVNGDDRLDVFVANDTVANFLFLNRGDGSFEEVGAASGTAFDAAGAATGAMGIDVADLRNDAHLGFAVGNFSNQPTSLYVQQDERTLFADQAALEGVGAASRSSLTFGLVFFDADLDGRLDLVQVNGHLEPDISDVQASQHYAQPAQLFWNRGPDAASCFAAAPADALGDLARPVVGRGAAYADMDGDGDLDLAITTNGGPPLILRNDQQLGHHWLRVRLEGLGANHLAIGATVTLEACGIVQRRLVMPTRSYLSQVELPVTFGLGQCAKADSMRVAWPDGTTTDAAIDAIDQELVVAHPQR